MQTALHADAHTLNINAVAYRRQKWIWMDVRTYIEYRRQYTLNILTTLHADINRYAVTLVT